MSERPLLKTILSLLNEILEELADMKATLHGELKRGDKDE